MIVYIIAVSLLAAFYGLFVGSFLNVCIYRIPIGETLVASHSHCTTCEHKLAWYDLFPLFSYLFLGGKCRYCKTHISAQYPIIEALNSVIWGLTFYFTLSYSHWDILGFRTIASAVIYCLFFSALIVLSGIDFFHRIVPDRVNLFILILGIALTAVDYNNLASHVIGFFAVSVPFFILTLLGCMGFGDTKLYAVAGLVIGWKAALISVLLACLTGAVISLPSYIIQKKKGVKHPRIPFVPFIAIGMFIAVFWADALINWYISTFLSGLIQ
jgi:leader peptidase (prepilin peptidase)/N-methyltransferase